MSRQLNETSPRGMSPELGPLLAEDVGRATEREKTYFDRAFASANGQVVLFGAGGLGRKALIGLRRVGIEPLAFADNDPERWGQVIGGLPVLAPGEAAGAYGGAALFLLTIWRPFGFDAPATLRQLRELGCRAVLPFAGLAWRYPEVFLPHPGIDLPRGVVEQAEDVRRAADLWADEPSRDEYVAQLAWRLTLDVTGLRPPDDEPQYFPRDLLRVSQDETFVDGGAFDGDTIRSLLGQRDDFAGCVVAIEPDPFSYAGLRRFVDGLPQHCRTRIVTLPLAVSDRRERLPFDATGTVSSAVRTDGEGSCAVDAAPLDEILAEVDPDLVPTFIKLDVEGAELAALAGARALIVRHRPILAVCAYHQQDHLWKVPLRLRGLGPDYRLYLRRYGNTIWDLVCYAIPPGRLVGSLSCFAALSMTGVALAPVRKEVSSMLVEPTLVAGRDRLDALLAVSADELLAREAERRLAAEVALGGAADLVLYGASYLGQLTLDRLRRNGGAPVAFADRDPARQGRALGGVPILSPEDAARRHGVSAAFVVTIWQLGRHFPAIRSRLSGAGCARVATWLDLYWRHADAWLPLLIWDRPSRLVPAFDELRQAFDLWADDASRAEYLAQLRHRLLLDDDPWPAPTAEAIYFGPGLWQPPPDEVYVDCGAYDGDSIRDFCRERGRDFRKIIAFEPDPENFRRLQASLRALEPAGRCALYPLAVGAGRAEVRFQAEGSALSARSESAALVVDCAPLDEVLAEEMPTLIKLDVEGAELDGLVGARATINRARPVLAICAYHQPDHLWRIPLLVRALVDDYRLYLRRYADDGFELVCYAVPAERASGHAG